MTVNYGDVWQFRAMAEEASRNEGRGKHDDPAYYSRNLSRLLTMACDWIEQLGGQVAALVENKNEAEASFAVALLGHKNHIDECHEALRKILEGSEGVRQEGLVEACRIMESHFRKDAV